MRHAAQDVRHADVLPGRLVPGVVGHVEQVSCDQLQGAKGDRVRDFIRAFGENRLHRRRQDGDPASHNLVARHRCDDVRVREDHLRIQAVVVQEKRFACAGVVHLKGGVAGFARHHHHRQGRIFQRQRRIRQVRRENLIVAQKRNGLGRIEGIP